MCQWLWAVLLGDGTRALVAAEWDRVQAHSEQHRGVGQRLFDGRQVGLSRNLAREAVKALAVAGVLEVRRGDGST